MSGESIEDIEPRVKEALAKSSVTALRELRVERMGESLLIMGEVPSFYCKQLAQELALAVTKDVPLINQVNVSEA